MNNFANNKGFKIIHQNIRSLFRNQHEFFMHFKGFDIIALSETWLHYNIRDCLIEEPGYSIMRQDRTTETGFNVKSRGGGLLIYIKNNLWNYVTKLVNPTPFSRDLKHLWLMINIPFRRKIVFGL